MWRPGERQMSEVITIVLGQLTLGEEEEWEAEVRMEQPVVGH